LPRHSAARAVYQLATTGDVTDQVNFSSSNSIATVVNSGDLKAWCAARRLPRPCGVVITAQLPPSGLTNTDGAITVAPG
jgi:hypothetical protein